MLRVLLLACLGSLVFAGPPKVQPDIENPRSAGTPLTVVFTPFWCNQCTPETAGFEEPKGKITLLRAAPEKFAELIGLDDGWVLIQTKNFRILSTLRKAKVKKKDSRFARYDLVRLQSIFPKLKIGRDGATLNAHQRAHLYHIRVERIYSHYSALIDNKKPFLGMLARYELFLFDEYTEHHQVADRFIGSVNDKAGVMDHRRDKPNFMIFTTAESLVSKNDGKGDRFFGNHIAHNVTHLLADGTHNYYRETWAWLEEGLAHYYERMEQPKNNTFCWTEGKKPDDLLKSDWQAVIYNQVRRGRDTSLSEWCEKLQPGELTAVEQGLCWSIVTWLIETEPVRLAKLMTRIDDTKAKPTATESIQFAFGVSPSVLHARWREWVLAKGKK